MPFLSIDSAPSANINSALSVSWQYSFFQLSVPFLSIDSTVSVNWKNTFCQLTVSFLSIDSVPSVNWQYPFCQLTAPFQSIERTLFVNWQYFFYQLTIFCKLTILCQLREHFLSIERTLSVNWRIPFCHYWKNTFYQLTVLFLSIDSTVFCQLTAQYSVNWQSPYTTYKHQLSISVSKSVCLPWLSADIFHGKLCSWEIKVKALTK